MALDTRPDWAKDLTSIRDTGVLAAIYEEVASHEQRLSEALDSKENLDGELESHRSQLASMESEAHEVQEVRSRAEELEAGDFCRIANALTEARGQR